VSRTEIGELSVVDGGDGASFTGAVSSFPAAVADVLAETGRAIGVDMTRLMHSKAAGGQR
jgi:flotillin